MSEPTRSEIADLIPESCGTLKQQEAVVDAILALFAHRPTMAQIKAEALREAADDMYAIFVRGRLLGPPTDVWLRNRADHIESEPSDD